MQQGKLLLGKCEGSSAPVYHLRTEIDDGGVRSAECSCPYDSSGLCKHQVAFLLAYVHSPGDFIERKPVASLLKGLDREELVGLLEKFVENDPDLYSRLEMAATASNAGKTGGQAPREKRKTGVSEQAYRRQVKNILHSLSGYRTSEAYWMMGGMVEQLRQVEETADQFLEAGDAEGALTVLMVILEETGGSYEQFDDSDGELGEFLGELGQSLAEAILSADLPDQERNALKKRLEPMVNELESYGIDEIAVAMTALVEGWEALDRSESEDEEDGGGMDLTQAKLNVLERQGLLDEYLHLCQVAGEHRRYTLKLLEIGRKDEAVMAALNHLTSAEDAQAVAQRLREMGDIRDAMAVGERGLNLAGNKHSLGAWLGPLEEAQGRAGQALQAHLVAFRGLPSLEQYQTLQRLSGADWGQLKLELISVLKSSAFTSVLADVYLQDQEWDAAVQLAEASNWDFRLLEKVVEAVLIQRPEWVIRVSLNQAEQLIAKTQSKYYSIAASWLQRAKKAYALLGKQSEWQNYLAALKVQYSRRPALQAELRRL
jgi:uncharacterized Zn finger protein